MERIDLHLHTTYSDGENTPEEMILAALQAGLSVIGFADHSFTSFDQSYCIRRERMQEYRDEIAALREKYRGKIEVKCGIEQDYYSEESTEGLDFVIGSVHYLRVGEEYFPVDENIGLTRDAVDRLFGGDPYALAEQYFSIVADVVRKTGATLIGHFDLVSKFNQKTPWLDEDHPRYRAAWQAAADALLKTGVPFEINSGAVTRGHRTVPYPAPPIREYLEKHGATFLCSSDSHSAAALLQQAKKPFRD